MDRQSNLWSLVFWPTIPTSIENMDLTSLAFIPTSKPGSLPGCQRLHDRHKTYFSAPVLIQMENFLCETIEIQKTFWVILCVFQTLLIFELFLLITTKLCLYLFYCCRRNFFEIVALCLQFSLLIRTIISNLVLPFCKITIWFVKLC